VSRHSMLAWVSGQGFLNTRQNEGHGEGRCVFGEASQAIFQTRGVVCTLTAPAEPHSLDTPKPGMAYLASLTARLVGNGVWAYNDATPLVFNDVGHWVVGIGRTFSTLKGPSRPPLLLSAFICVHLRFRILDSRNRALTRPNIRPTINESGGTPLRHGLACRGHLFPQLPRRVARTRRAMTKEVCRAMTMGSWP
jgi:hypothetical protein